MARDTDAIIQNPGRFAATPTTPVANIANGGAQLGLGPHLARLDSATPLSLPPLVPVVVQTPTMFDEVDGMNDVCRALIEMHAREITGVDINYTVESTPIPVGHDGQTVKIPTNARRAEISPQFSWPEITGNLVWEFHREWLGMIRNPDTQAALSGEVFANAAAQPQLFSTFTMDVAFIQYDATFRPENILDGFMVTTMWPQETGIAGYRRTVGEVSVPERSITYNGVLQHNRNTRLVCQQIAELLSLHRPDFNLAVPVASKIADRLSGLGLERDAAESLQSFTEVA